MIKKLHIKNFRSIKELTVDFSFAEGKAPNDYDQMERLPFVEDAGIRCVPVSAFFGANAAGKSNIIRALVFIMLFMTGKRSPTWTFLFEPNLLLECGRDTELILEYVFAGYCCIYAIRYNQTGLLEEKFICDGVQLFHVTDGHNVVFDKSIKMPSLDYNSEMFSRALQTECTDYSGRYVLTLASLLASRFTGLDKIFNTCLFDFSTRVVVTGTEPVTLPQVLDEIKNLTGESQEDSLNEIVGILRELDIDILGINIQEFTLQQADPEIKKAIALGAPLPEKVFSIQTLHQDLKGQKQVFDFIQQESEGTIRLATMIGRCLRTLKTNGVLCVDELERSLHPLLVKELLKLFQMRDYNTGTAQLIFTTHLAQLLDDSVLRLSEVTIVDKNRQRGTKIKRLIDLKNDDAPIRNVTNFRKRYLHGYYSGIPQAAL